MLREKSEEQDINTNKEQSDQKVCEMKSEKKNDLPIHEDNRDKLICPACKKNGLDRPMMTDLVSQKDGYKHYLCQEIDKAIFKQYGQHLCLECCLRGCNNFIFFGPKALKEIVEKNRSAESIEIDFDRLINDYKLF